ncbi:F-box protein PP2-B11-like [Cornus florida]|uniref:F-box protein PP2-B11-like n=1 Tax=Cornus florida TaxID=4283 RepID=UPI00289E7DEA|nr:F-box protein PP2-B11-like [Cornus florida]
MHAYQIVGREKMATETSRNPCPVTDINGLPENCIANVLSLTNPPETCRLSLVASTFRSAADSDSVWETFLPSDYQDLIGRASDSSRPVFASKKELYLRLSNHPLIIDGGTKSFSLEKWSGKKCFMLAARYLTIVWGDTPRYWKWTSLPESRFTEVAELVDVCWLEIRGKIHTQMLSPATTYAAYLVFKWATTVYGFGHRSAEGWVRISGSEGESRSLYLDPDGWQWPRTQIVPRRMGFFNRRPANMVRPLAAMLRQSNDQCPKERGDGWFEMELGEHLNKSGEDGELEICLQEVKGGNWKSGLILQGIELRPKNSK